MAGFASATAGVDAGVAGGDAVAPMVIAVMVG